jgi:hypothetical protein
MIVAFRSWPAAVFESERPLVELRRACTIDTVAPPVKV